MANHVCSARDLFHATYHVANDPSNPKHLQHWTNCVNKGGSMHETVNFGFYVDVLSKKQYVARTAFEHMLRTWNLPDLAYAMQILGPQNTISLPHLTTHVRQCIHLYRMDTGDFCNVANTMKHWAHYVNKAAEAKQWYKSEYVPATKSWVSASPWPSTSIFAWEALWGRCWKKMGGYPYSKKTTIGWRPRSRIA